VINFWATWCSLCLKEMPELELFYQRYRNSAEVWGVTFEDSAREKILEYRDRIGVNYPILGHGHGQDPLTGYGEVTGLPTTFIIDPDGLFFHRFEGAITAQDIVEVIPDF
jgi:thiol-disulfide isomerase/thioredoxin